MALRRYGKKRRGGRRRRTRRVTRNMSMTKRLRNVYYFTRYAYQGAPQTSFTTDANGQYFGVCIAQGISGIFSSISVLSMPNVTEFTGLFDQYKILSFTFELHPRFNGRDAAYGPGTVADIPTIYWVYDSDDATTPVTANAIMEHAKVHTARLYKPVRITVKYPCVATEIYSSALVTGYAPKRAPWIDCNSTSVQHYGFKFMIQGPPTRDYKDLFDIRVRWRLALKNPR